MISLWTHSFLSVLSFFLTLIFVSSILRTQRAAGSTLAWLFVICLLPYVGIPLYLFLSGRKLKARTRAKAAIYPDTSSVRLPEGLSSTQRILSAGGAPEARSNRLVGLLPNGVDAYTRLLELVRGAKKSIYITTFIFGNDPVGKAVVEALSERAAAGLDVRILLDSMGATLIRHPSFKSLIDAGGKTAYFMPILHLPFRGRSNFRNHRKLVVVDGQFALLGGMNLAQEYMGPAPDPDRWIDLAVQLEGPCVGDLENIFLQDWGYAVHQTTPAIDQPTSGTAGDRFLAQVVASGPDVSADPLYDVLLSAIHGSKKSVWIVTPYFIPDESLTKALELAAKRGVAVHVVIPRRSNHRLADLARTSFVRQLGSAGVAFALYPRMIHAKAVLVDGAMAILGSANFDMRSLLLNYELGLVIYDEGVLKSIEDWVRQRQSESSSETQKSGYIRELAEGIGRVIGPIL